MFFISFFILVLNDSIQKNFNGSNTDGSFTTAVSNSFLSSLEKMPIAADLGCFSYLY